MPDPGSARRFRRLLAYLRPYHRQEFWGISALLIVNLVGIYIPNLIGHAIDNLQADLSFQQVTLYALWISLLACGMWGIRMFSRIVLFGVGRQVEFDLKQGIFEHLLRLEPAYFAVHSVGDLINRATSDVDNIRRLVGFAVLSLVNTLFAYALTLPAMMLIDVKLSLLAIAVYPLMLVMVQLFSDRLQQEQALVQEQLSDLSSLLQEDISGMSLIKIYAQEENERRAFRRVNQNLYEGNLQLARTRNILFPLLTGLASLSLLILLFLGGDAIAQGRLSVGDFVELILYVERLVFPTALLGFTITAYQRGEISIDRVEAILMAEPGIQSPEDAQPLPLEQVRGYVKIDHLTYTYPGAPTPALRDVSLAIAPGETVAIVGPIGSGKSTLIAALPRLLKIQPQQVFLDHHDITQIPLEDLRRAIAYVPQDSFLFSTTIYHNIAYGDPLASPALVEEAARLAQIHGEILNFPQQYETLVGERGITLSGGQRQRTALARALLIQAPILILDDALSSVDNQTATQILQNLAMGAQRKTVIFISHQLTAAAQADRIVVMDQGQVVQVGTHPQLLAQTGLYQSLWQRQKLEATLKA